MTRRRLSLAILTTLTVVLAACSSPTAPTHDCTGVTSGSGTCH